MKALRIHKSRKHKAASRSPLPIPQLDGDSCNEAFEENYCKVCEECPDEIETSEDVNYHVMNDHEVNAVISMYGHSRTLQDPFGSFRNLQALLDTFGVPPVTPPKNLGHNFFWL